MSNSKKPVVVYGASGYTGRLVCEFLRQYAIPFIAAGRDAARIQEVMDHVPGIETADYEVAEVDNTVEDLTKLFDGVKVVCNIVGPFERFGEPVVEAALAAGAHYIDTTGEPAFVETIANKFGQGFADAGLAMLPCAAYMYTPVDIAIHLCIEPGDMQVLECVTAGTFVPTFASTQSIYSLFSHDARYLKNNELVPWVPAKGYDVPVPGFATTQLMHPWAGGNMPLIYKDHPVVHSVRQLSGNTDRDLMEGLIALQADFEANVRSLPEKERKAALDGIVDQIEPFMPPRESTLIHKSCDIVTGQGSSGSRKVVIQSTSPYTQTGLFQAATAAKLLACGTQKAGFGTACQAVGHEYLLGQLKAFLPAKVTIEEL
ncbi:MAG: trans-acting enoyl reductase family protein [Lysobacterales bacterium]